MTFTVTHLRKIIQAIIYKGESQYIGECLDLPVVTQGRSLDEVTANVQEAISLHLENEDLSDWNLVAEPSVIASFELEPLVHAKA